MLKRVLTPKQLWILLGAAGLLLRAEYLREYARQLTFPFALGADVQEYHARALELLSGQYFPRLPDIHAPLYSVFLALLYALTGDAIPFVRLLQLLLNWGAWFLGAKTLERLQTPPRVIFCFFGLGMLVPVLFFHQAELISESLLLPLVFGELYALVRAEDDRNRWRFLPAGLLAGCALLTHGLFLPFAAAETGLLLFRRKRRDALVYCGAALLLILPVTAAKTLHYGKLTGLQENSGFNFWLGNNPEATGGCYLRPGADWRKLHRQAEKEAGEQHTTPQRIFLKKSLHFWLHDPLRAIGLWLRKGVLVWSPRELLSGADPAGLLYATPLQKYGAPLLTLIFLFALSGAWHKEARSDRYRHYFLLIAAFWAAQVITVTSGRYRMAMMPGVFLLAAWGIAYAKWRHLGFLVLCGVLFPFTFPLTREKALAEQAESWSIQGEAAFRRGDYAAAERLLAAASRHFHDPSRFENFAGIFCERRGDFPGAVAHYRKAIASEPELAEGWMNLANLASHDPRQAETAEKLYQRALQKAPWDPLVHFNHAQHLHRCGKEAEPELWNALRLDPRLAEAWNLLGVRAMNRREYNAAAACFFAAHQAAPQHPGYEQNLNVAREAAERAGAR